MKQKQFVQFIEEPKQTGIPITPKEEWPAFPAPAKPSANSPFRTVLWFHAKFNKGVRVIVEGRDEKAVAAYAQLITGGPSL